MPSSTFFRLPEEKRQRLLDAAWEEFSRVSFADASINQIIHAANISRGSFYQYFTDKEDLTAYMLGGMRHYFSKLMWNILAEVEGDLFRAVVIAFERFLDRSGITDPVLAKLIHIIQLNPGMDFHRFMCSDREASEQEIFQHVSNRNYRSQDREFVGNVFFLTIAPLASAMMETLRAPEQWEHQRALLERRLQIIRMGAVAPAISEQPNSRS